MSGNAPQNVDFVWRNIFRHLHNEITGNGRKGVPVVKTEWSELVALQTNIDGFRQREFFGLILLPKILCGCVPVRGGFMQRVFLLAKAAIDFRDQFPIKRCEPTFGQARHAIQ